MNRIITFSCTEFPAVNLAVKKAGVQCGQLMPTRVIARMERIVTQQCDVYSVTAWRAHRLKSENAKKPFAPRRMAPPVALSTCSGPIIDEAPLLVQRSSLYQFLLLNILKVFIGCHLQLVAGSIVTGNDCPFMLLQRTARPHLGNALFHSVL